MNDDLVKRLREFEMSDDIGDGDFSTCMKAADRIEQLEKALRHCANAIAEWERKPLGIGPFLLGALDNARTALSQPTKEPTNER